MFDDPKKRLQELDSALRAAEAEEDWLQETDSLFVEFDGEQPNPTDLPRIKYADEIMSESDALYVEKPQRKGAGGLVILALLELIAICLILLWWIKWTL